MKKRGLGRGLDALLGSTAMAAETAVPVAATEGEATPAMTGLRQLPVDLIDRSPYQPRSHFSEDALQELADSIREQGIIQPIVVRVIGSRFELIAGERRWRAAQLAGLHEVPAVVRDDVGDQAAIAMALIENIQRRN